MHNEDENEFLQTESSRKKEMRDSYWMDKETV
jgi:hypothetical protein